MPEKTETDFRSLLAPSIISKIKSLELRARMVVEGFMIGLHQSPYHGFSVEFTEHKPYMQGDSLRNIDWKVYGKTEKLFIKQYEEETNLKSYIVLDTSNSMSFGSEGNVKKIQYAQTLAAALSYLMISQQDAVGLALYDTTITKLLPPKASKPFLRELLLSLSQISTSEKTNTAGCLNLIAEKINRRGMVIIISDLFDDIDSVLNAFKHFRYKKNEVIVFQVLDPLERNFAFGKDAVFRDLESLEEMTTQPYQIQKVYSSAIENYINTIKSECLNSNIDYNLIETSETFEKALFTYLQKRARLI